MDGRAHLRDKAIDRLPHPCMLVGTSMENCLRVSSRSGIAAATKAGRRMPNQTLCRRTYCPVLVLGEASPSYWTLESSSARLRRLLNRFPV